MGEAKGSEDPLDEAMTPSLVESARLASFGLVVLIWLVQIVIYPGFTEVAPDRFVAWHARYTRAITWVVAPLMLAQAGLVGTLVAARPRGPFVAAAALVVVAWVATARVAVPLHDALRGGHDPVRIARLVRTNWVRTAAWTLAFLALLV